MVAAASAVFLLALIDHAAMLHSETHRSHHHSHALLPAVGGAFTADADHTHFFHGSLTEFHDALASVVLPRAATTLVELGVAVAVFVITAAQACLIAPFVRGPPKVPRAASPGKTS